MKQASRYGCFDRNRSKEMIEQNHREIEQAIDEVTGRVADRQIRKIWQRVLK